MKTFVLAFLLALSTLTHATEKAPDKLVVLTFDDSVASHATNVAPLLKKYGFGATFFITEGFEFAVDKKNYMTWEQIKALHDQGFEIGNHTHKHASVGGQNAEQLTAAVEYIEKQCEKNGIPRPITFCYPGYQTSDGATKVLRERGYKLARAGGGRVFDPEKDEPLTLPQAFDSKPDCTLEDFKKAVAAAQDGKIAVMTFHGVPDIKHPWVNTAPEKFEAYLAHLKEQGCKVVALKEILKYVPEKK
jgi:peptidoglycan/xylan/chitin deacetylase (PgdA/CDA1 family)